MTPTKTATIFPPVPKNKLIIPGVNYGTPIAGDGIIGHTTVTK